MKVSTKGWLVTATGLLSIGLIGVMIWWANAEVEDAERQRSQSADISRVLNDLRLVTFEFILHRGERPRLQERNAQEHLQRLLADHPLVYGEPAEWLSELKSNSAAVHRIFEELAASAVSRVMDEDAAEAARRSEALLSSRLLMLQQECLADAFRLNDAANVRITEAQRGVVLVIAVGLSLIALAMCGAALLLHREVLTPIARLQEATREVAAGNWKFQINIGANDEIGEMSRNFNAMTQALCDSFGEIQRKNEELAALNMEIEAFSYSVSHDLRAPLRAMDGFSLALLEDYGERLDDEGQDCLKRIRAASQRMGRLIDELLGLSRVTRTELTIRSVDLSAIAREIAELLQRQQPQPQRQVQWVIDDGIYVQADRSLMQIAMQNLLENAWKFTAKTENAVIRVGAVEHDGNMDCFVADNGVGFDMAYADRLFGAFQRLHHETEFSGTGIGLAIVQRILRRHEGRIWVHASPGHGATFFFSLKGQAHARAEQDHPAGGGQPGRRDADASGVQAQPLDEPHLRSA
ncbi:MAG TPA: ATP-binding protein [Burkholderiaceae bacterium]|nr:ATP-binding protein [Burkholderiaceae bacterium]